MLSARSVFALWDERRLPSLEIVVSAATEC